MDTLIFLKDLLYHIWAFKVLRFFLIAKGYYGEMPCLLSEGTDWPFVSTCAFTHRLSPQNRSRKRKCWTYPSGNTDPGRLERIEKYKLSSKRQVCFFYIWFKQSKLKKKKKSMRAREEKGGRKMSLLKIPLESQPKPININTGHLYPWMRLEIHGLALGNPAVHGSFWMLGIKPTPLSEAEKCPFSFVYTLS